MRFLLDTNVPKGLTQWIVSMGHAAEHVLNIGLGQTLDRSIWNRAQEDGAIIISKDEDFADMVLRSGSGPSVVWLRTGNGTTKDLIHFLHGAWPAIEDRLRAGDRLVEVR